MRNKTLLSLIAALFVTATASAQSGSNEVALKISNASYSSTTEDDPAGSVELSFKGRTGYGASFNHYWTNRVSTEFGIDSLESRLHISSGGVGLDVGKLETTALTALAQYHFGSNARFDPYAGGGIAYMSGKFKIDNPDIGENDSVDLKNDFTWAADAGVNFRVTPRAAIGLDAKYIPYRPTDESDADRLDVNPIIYSLSVRFRF